MSLLRSRGYTKGNVCWKKKISILYFKKTSLSSIVLRKCDKNNTFILTNFCPKLSGIAHKTCVRKPLTDSMQKLFKSLWCKRLLSQQYHFRTFTNERTINRILNNTRKIKRTIPNLIFDFFSKCVNLADINANSKCVDLVPTFNALWCSLSLTNRNFNYE